MKRIGIFITLYTFALLFVKAQENNLQLIFLENNQLTFSEPYPVKYYNLIQKKKVDGIKLFFSDSTKIIPLQNVWGLIYENTSEKETDTFIIDKLYRRWCWVDRVSLSMTCTSSPTNSGSIYGRLR